MPTQNGPSLASDEGVLSSNGAKCKPSHGGARVGAREGSARFAEARLATVDGGSVRDAARTEELQQLRGETSLSGEMPATVLARTSRLESL